MEHPHNNTPPDNEPHPIGRRQYLKNVLSLGVAGMLSASSQSRDSAQTPEAVPDYSNLPIDAETQAIGSEGLNLLHHMWSSPGIDVQPDRLHIIPAPATIVNKEEDGDERVLPFNTEYRFMSDAGFQLAGTFTLNETGSEASLLLAETLPLIYDEFQFPGKGIRLTLANQTGTLEAWDGERHDPAIIDFQLDNASLTKNIVIQKADGQLMIAVDGQVVGEVANYTGQQTWLGLEAKADTFDAVALSMVPLEGNTLSVANMRALKVDTRHAKGLRTLAKRRSAICSIGAAVALAPLYDNQKYAALLAGNFDILTTENSLKPQFVQPQEGVFHTDETQHLIDFAARHNMLVHGHALLPNRSLPKWMRELATDTAQDKLRVRQVMIDHITGVLQRFPLLHSIDVINEPLKDWGWREDTIWHKAMGDQFIDIALATAYEVTRQTNPDIILTINENAIDKDDAWDEARFTMLKQKMIALHKPGMKLALGFEGHVYEAPRDNMSPEALARRMAVLQEHGFLARVSEMDVTTRLSTSKHATPKSLYNQAEQFGSIARVCMEAANCVSFTMWGIGGKYASTTRIDENGKLQGVANLPWDEQLQQRPLAYRTIRNALR